jgi:hypothetical protein
MGSIVYLRRLYISICLSSQVILVKHYLFLIIINNLASEFGKPLLFYQLSELFCKNIYWQGHKENAPSLEDRINNHVNVCYYFGVDNACILYFISLWLLDLFEQLWTVVNFWDIQCLPCGYLKYYNNFTQCHDILFFSPFIKHLFFFFCITFFGKNPLIL